MSGLLMLVVMFIQCLAIYWLVETLRENRRILYAVRTERRVMEQTYRDFRGVIHQMKKRMGWAIRKDEERKKAEGE